MKLRLTNQSIRLRLLRSDISTLTAKGRVEETIVFAPGDSFTFALATDASIAGTTLRRSPSEILILLPASDAKSWVESEQVGIYAVQSTQGQGPLELMIEKDFACLDLSDAENVDTFPNPQTGAAC